VVAASAAERVVRLSRTSLITGRAPPREALCPHGLPPPAPPVPLPPLPGVRAWGRPVPRRASHCTSEPRHTAEGLQGVFTRNQVQLAGEMGWVPWEPQREPPAGTGDREGTGGERRSQEAGGVFSRGPVPGQVRCTCLTESGGWTSGAWMRRLPWTPLQCTLAGHCERSPGLSQPSIEEPALVRVSWRDTVCSCPPMQESRRRVQMARLSGTQGFPRCASCPV